MGGLFSISNMVSGNPVNQKLARESGCIELIKDIIGNSAIRDDGNEEIAPSSLSDIVYGNPENQKRACELGLVDLMLNVIEQRQNEKYVVEESCVSGRTSLVPGDPRKVVHKGRPEEGRGALQQI